MSSERDDLQVEHTARFFIGQLVRHLKFDYRGVVFDIDATFEGSDDWYDTVARSRPPKDQPWYHVLVDGSDDTTYVAERHLKADDHETPIEHPLLPQLCGEFRDGRYAPKSGLQ